MQRLTFLLDEIEKFAVQGLAQIVQVFLINTFGHVRNSFSRVRFIVPAIENGEELCIRVYFSFFSSFFLIPIYYTPPKLQPPRKISPFLNRDVWRWGRAAGSGRLPDHHLLNPNNILHLSFVALISLFAWEGQCV